METFKKLYNHIAEFDADLKGIDEVDWQQYESTTATMAQFKEALNEIYGDADLYFDECRDGDGYRFLDVWAPPELVGSFDYDRYESIIWIEAK